MKKFLSGMITFLGVLLVIFLTVFVVWKIRKDTLIEKGKDIDMQNSIAESEYLCNIANENISAIKKQIESDVEQSVEVADIGSLDKTDIYFVTKVDNEYKYIIKEKEENVEKFKIAQDNDASAKYIVSMSLLKLDTCIYTNIKDYTIDKSGKITYNK